MPGMLGYARSRIDTARETDPSKGKNSACRRCAHGGKVRNLLVEGSLTSDDDKVEQGPAVGEEGPEPMCEEVQHQLEGENLVRDGEGRGFMNMVYFNVERRSKRKEIGAPTAVKKTSIRYKTSAGWLPGSGWSCA